jgi:hypothetical protein
MNGPSLPVAGSENINATPKGSSIHNSVPCESHGFAVGILTINGEEDVNKRQMKLRIVWIYLDCFQKALPSASAGAPGEEFTFQRIVYGTREITSLPLVVRSLYVPTGPEPKAFASQPR